MVIYTNTAGGTVTTTQIDKLKSEVAEAQIYYWRNSHMKCYLTVEYCIIDEYKSINDFWQIWTNAYWMGPSAVDADLRERGYSNGEVASVINFYAWGQNGYGAAYGGGALGVNAILGTSAYVGIPFCWDPNTNDAYFIHEFHHNLDAMWDASGHPEYPHADYPQNLPGDFGETYDFNAFILRTWPVELWTTLRGPWGYPMQVTDIDHDGVPDTGPFPIVEQTFLSNIGLTDTDSDDLDDLGEAMGGIWSSCKPTIKDSDGDGLADGVDKYPIYAISEYTPKATRSIDGSIESAWHILGSPMAVAGGGLTSTIHTNWDSNYLYVALKTNKSCLLHVYIDADNDGWFHGKDNYELIIDPTLSRGSQLVKVHIFDCSPAALAKYGGCIWDDDEKYTDPKSVLPSDIQVICNVVKTLYNIEIGIPRNTTTKMIPQHGDRIGLRFWYERINGDWSYRAFAFEQDSFADIVLMDAASLTRDTKIPSMKARTDGQWIDLVGKTVSAVFNGCFYVQDEDRTSGIKVISSEPVQIGDKVRVIGQLGLTAGEREMRSAIVDKLPSTTPH